MTLANMNEKHSTRPRLVGSTRNILQGCMSQSSRRKDEDLEDDIMKCLAKNESPQAEPSPNHFKNAQWYVI